MSSEKRAQLDWKLVFEKFVALSICKYSPSFLSTVLRDERFHDLFNLLNAGVCFPPGFCWSAWCSRERRTSGEFAWLCQHCGYLCHWLKLLGARRAPSHEQYAAVQPELWFQISLLERKVQSDLCFEVIFSSLS